MTTNGFGANDYDLAPSSMKYRDLQEDGESVSGRTTGGFSTTVAKPESGGTRFTTRELVLIAIIVILIIISMGIGIAAVTKNTSYSAPITSYQIIAKNGTKGSYPTSCKDALAKGYTKSGPIMIKPAGVFTPFQVFCDMEVSGGGWTLISSIHENAANEKCQSGDKWSSETSRTSYYSSRSTSTVSVGYSSWMNLLTFGSVVTSTSADYKSKAYYSVPASDVMIWHVPNNVQLSQISKKAYFKYHTTSGFLKNNGGTLKELYNRYAQLKRLSPKGMQLQFMPCLKSNWTTYNSSSGSSSSDKPKRLSDRISISLNNKNYIKLAPGLKNNVSSQINVTFDNTKGSSTMMAWVENTDKSIKKISLKIDGFPKPTRSYLTYSSNNKMQFRYSYGCAVKCKVIFYIGSSMLWDSSSPGLSVRQVDNSYYTFNISYSFQRFIFGYHIFPKSPKGRPSRNEFRKMAKTLLNCLSKVEVYDLNKNPPISVPATFVKGQMSDYNKNVTPGFIEFRKYDSFGYPYALCPGIRVKSHADPSLHCVGTVQTYYSVRDKCGDFAAWDLLAEHTKKKTSDGVEYTDVTSSLLLFTR